MKTLNSEQLSWLVYGLAGAGIVLLIMLNTGQLEKKTPYDFDLECAVQDFKWDNTSEPEKFHCFGGSGNGVLKFSIICDGKTVQMVDDYWYCETFAGKSVRIHELHGKTSNE